jgi:hypothetical protein
MREAAIGPHTDGIPLGDPRLRTVLAPLRLLTSIVGAGRLLFGTDLPFDMAAGPVDDQAAAAGLGRTDLVTIAGLDASQLFGLGPRQGATC